MAPTKERPATKSIATNREARHEYFVLEALETGCWLHHIHSGDFVEEGQVLGRITDVFGNTLTTYYAEQTGVILYVCPALASPKGTILVAYGTIKEFDDEE